jgi:hypothetical protein
LDASKQVRGEYIMVSHNNRKNGYSLSILMVALLAISVAAAVLLPVMTKKRDSETNISYHVQRCIVSENAASFASGTACYAAATGLSNGATKDYSTILYYLNGDNSAYSNAASKIIGNACDAGDIDACDVFIQRCANNSANCDSNSVNNVDLGDYLRLTVPNAGSTYIMEKAGEYYIHNVTNFVTLINDTCQEDPSREACSIYATSYSETYSFNSATATNYLVTTGTTPGLDVSNGSYFHIAAGASGDACNKSGYFTTNLNHITDMLDIKGAVKSVSISANQRDGAIKGLVSFDGRNNWCKAAGTTWNCNIANADLANGLTTGNTIAEIQTGLTNYILPEGRTSFDFAFYLASANAGACQQVDITSLTINYHKAR